MGQKQFPNNKKYIELNENENNPYKNVWETAKIPKGKFTVLITAEKRKSLKSID